MVRFIVGDPMYYGNIQTRLTKSAASTELSRMYSLPTLVKRLEAVTSRLEDIATYAEGPGNAAFVGNSVRDLLGSVELQVTPQASEAPVPTESDPKPEQLPRHIEEFDEFIEHSVGQYVRLSSQIGGTVAEQASHVRAAFVEQRRILVLAITAKKPDALGWKDILQATNDAASQVVSIQENSTGDSLHDNLSCVADGIPVLGWITVEMFAFRHVDKFLEYAQYFGNKVTVKYKKTDPKHVEWVQSYYQVIQDLSDLMKRNFQSGVSWRVGDRANE